MNHNRPVAPPAVLLLQAIDEARSMLGAQTQEVDDMPPAGGGNTLLQQCLALCDASTIGVEPVRTVHHMACTGGTVICKCLSTMPNVQLLSEVDPLSPLVSAGSGPKFTPTEVTAMLRWSTRDTDSETLVQLFQAQIVSLHGALSNRGRHLVLRDHAHSHFCTGTGVPERPSLREMVQAIRPVRSVVTVRNPFDSFCSLSKNMWLHFEPATFAEYCARYNAFLDHYDDLSIFRLEDITADPQAQLKSVCDALDLTFCDTFTDTFSAFRLSGDSGRRSDVLLQQPRRNQSLRLQSEFGELAVVRELLDRLGYSPDA